MASEKTADEATAGSVEAAPDHLDGVVRGHKFGELRGPWRPGVDELREEAAANSRSLGLLTRSGTAARKTRPRERHMSGRVDSGHSVATSRLQPQVNR